MSMFVEFQDGDGCDGLSVEGSVMMIVKLRCAVDRLGVRLGPWKAPRCYQLRAIQYTSADSGWWATGATACRVEASPARSVRG
eukprot:4640127-Pleurochrysis_carterae.AAC.1